MIFKKLKPSLRNFLRFQLRVTRVCKIANHYVHRMKQLKHRKLILINNF